MSIAKGILKKLVGGQFRQGNLGKVHGLIEQVDGPETALAALKAILDMRHVFASAVESQRTLVDKTKELGLTWVKDGQKQGEGHFEAKR